MGASKQKPNEVNPLLVNTKKTTAFSVSSKEKKVAVIHLNKELQLLSFEGAAQQFINISSNNISCPIYHFSRNFEYENFIDDLCFCSDAQIGKQILLSNAGDSEEPYLLRIIPFNERNQRLISLIFYQIVLTEREHLLMTNQRRMKEQILALQEKNKTLQILNNELQQLACTTAHDLKQPLYTIGNLANLLKKLYGEELNGDRLDYLNLISQGVGNMKELICDLLEHTKYIHHDKKRFHQTDFNTILKGVFLNLAALIKENKVQIKLGKMPRNLWANKIKMRQVFQNLIENAIKFRKKNESCVVEISAEEQEIYWKFAVRDNGKGIAKKNHKIIFQFLKKLHSSEDYKGSGIGLATCKKIVEQHNGRIWVESKKEEGAIFYFTISKI